MKRIISIILSLMLIMGSISALAAPGDGTIYSGQMAETDFYISQMAWYDGVLYMSDYGEKMYTWTQSTSELKESEIPKDIFELDPEEETYGFRSLIAGDDGVYVLWSVEELDDDYGSKFDHMVLMRLNVDGETISYDGETWELEWDELVEDSDDYVYANNVNYAFIRDGKLIGQTWGENGNVVAVVDIEDDDMELWPMDDMGFDSICAYTEGKVLLSLRDYSADENAPVEILAMDIETGETETAMSMQVEGYRCPSHMAYDEENNDLYYYLNGELYKAAGMDAAAAQSVAALNIDGYGENPAFLTGDGFYIAADYNTIIIRNTDPSQRAEVSIRVYSRYNNAMEKALMAYAAANPEVEVISVDSYEDITKAMLNRSSEVDVYTLNVSEQGYAAVFDRGYMAELEGSQIISDYVNSVYPALQDVVSKDGHIYAIPVEMYVSGSWCYNTVVLEKLGLTEADLPTSWAEMLAFAKKFPEIVGDNPDGITFIDPYYDAYGAKNEMFYSIIRDYMLYLQRDDVEFAFDTELLRGLLTELESIDFVAMGYPEDASDDDRFVNYIYEENTMLFQSYGSIDSQVYSIAGSFRPLPLSMEDGGEPMISTSVDVAFVNPYSEHRDEAIEYLEYAVQNLPHAYRVNMCPDFNETLENEYYEEAINSNQEYLDSMYAELEKLESEEDKELLQQQIDEQEKWIEEYKANYRYDISEESIAFYRQYAGMFVPSQFIGFEEEASTEFNTQLSQYMDGAIDANTFLKNVDKKLKMMILEAQ